MQRRHEVVIAADQAQVWRHWSDVTSWPEYIDTVDEVDLPVGTLGPGATARIRQRRLPEDRWTVTAFDEGTGWTWEARGPGVHTVARHHLAPTGDGATLARAEIVQGGVVGRVVGALVAPIVARHLRAELSGLRRRCEAD